MLSPVIVNLVEKKLGREVCSPSGCESLQIDIFSTTKQTIGVNTIKRLFVVISQTGEPRLSTLNILANYLDFKDWDELNKYVTDNGNSVFHSIEEIDIRQLRPGRQVSFSYSPDRKVRLVLIENNLFKVIESVNSKLMCNDLLEINHFVLHFPLIITNVIRGGESMGRFTAGKISGITTLQLV